MNLSLMRKQIRFSKHSFTALKLFDVSLHLSLIALQNFSTQSVSCQINPNYVVVYISKIQYLGTALMFCSLNQHLIK